MKKFLILISIISISETAWSQNTKPDTNETKYIYCILRSNELERQLVKRDELIREAEWMNKAFADSIITKNKTINAMTEKNYKETKRKKNWRRLAAYEGGFILLLIISISTIIQ